MSSKKERAGGLTEPNPFTEDEFRAWRGFRRVNTVVEAELGARLEKKHKLSVLHYGVLIALVAAADRQLRMSDLAEKVLASASGMTRAVTRLRLDGLVEREQDPGDLRSVVVSLTPKGHRKLRAAQVTHHACVRELLFAGLKDDDLERLATIYDHAMPGIVDEPTWSTSHWRRT